MRVALKSAGRLWGGLGILRLLKERKREERGEGGGRSLVKFFFWVLNFRAGYDDH